MLRGTVGLICIVFLTLLFEARVDAFILINEILADPPTGIAGDANGDGVGSSNDDEFIELYNTGNQAVDLSGWSLSDATKSRHTFASNSLLSPRELLVIFGGGSPQLPGINWQIASTGTLSLNNTADTVTVFDQNQQIIEQVIYGGEAGHDQSIVRFPEGSDSSFIEHLSLPNANGLKYSVGYFVNPPVLPAEPPSVVTPPPTAVPEVPSLCYLGMGMPFMFLRRKWNIVRIFR